ncbi:protein of unknown function [Pseudodesulfovibrio profundus]|uniref:Uncharacterized protein n=1 Tax=Pseudodesulfovibrio profundus TaxID=57320 RepID=A0A2C8F7W7_9BACT|nr:protein of unknown function [Pseudodesulfovibrio profundus]
MIFFFPFVGYPTDKVRDSVYGPSETGVKTLIVSDRCGKKILLNQAFGGTYGQGTKTH